MGLITDVYTIVNPRAAHGQGGKKWDQIHECLLREKISVTVDFTERQMHAFELAKNAVNKGFRRIVCVGGDGTFNEIMNGILQSGTPSVLFPELAIIPVGTGSDFVRSLKIPLRIKDAVSVIKHGKIKLIDVGRAVFKKGKRKWQRYFANVFDAGIGGNVVYIANRIPKHMGGFMTFLLSSLIALVLFRRMNLKIWIDEQLIDNTLVTIVGAANGEFFGGGMHIAPMASIDDGKLEILYVKDINTFKFLVKILARVYKAEHLKCANVIHRQGKVLRVICNRVFLMETDGEEEKAEEVSVSILPRAIKLTVPG
jgi:diacylglycerol kinase (ATP)